MTLPIWQSRSRNTATVNMYIGDSDKLLQVLSVSLKLYFPVPSFSYYSVQTVPKVDRRVASLSLRSAIIIGYFAYGVLLSYWRCYRCDKN